MMLKKVLGLVVCSVFFVSSISFAGSGPSNDELLKEIHTLRKQIHQQEKRINELEKRLTEQESAPKAVKLSDGTIEDLDKHVLDGLKIGAGTTFVMQATHNANGGDASNKEEDVTDGSYSIDLVFEKEFEDYAKAFLQLETGDGAGVEDELTVFSNVNQDADDSDNSVSVTKAWYEHYIKDTPLTLTFGKIGSDDYIDGNRYASDECTQFLGRMFKHSPTIEFPDNSGGLHIGIAPSDSMEIDIVLSDADSDWEDIVGDVFFGTQLNFKPNLFDRDGNYRILGWLNDRDHTKWVDGTDVKKSSYGFGISFDQELKDDLGAFLRYGWQDPDVFLNGEDFSLERSWSLGLELKGSSWNRPEDTIGLAMGEIAPSNEYKNADSSRSAKDEGHLEVYYNYKVNTHLTLSPDLQIIWDPYGNDATNGDDAIVVGGVRAQMDF